MTLVKICGVKDAAGFDATVAAGADFVGFVFYPPSPRAVTPDAAAALSARAAGGPKRVGLFVDPTDALLAAVLAAVPLDLVQLHGEETPARAAEVRARFGRPVMKALGIAVPADLALLEAYAPVVDRFLLDAKPPPGASLPGGNAAAFDWRLVAGRAIPRPWLLAGGLTPETVRDAVRQTGAPGVDVSSGVERARGVKDPDRIAAFVSAAKAEGGVSKGGVAAFARSGAEPR
ncbi:phosphoribosylanthranilate isomerase [Paracraurococcus ruber]|uniref:N-(5'-phosphoribosyl)anthranilate isomerase n=1 Tax=Paracraurococcus ruber TaxID=77675 RepID=A0ABS1D2R5_9PROT|nr:phosphoribosylanthranilate isomerase [Paracraurococcus ruber]MBK1660841.1 phosphoribosylanthranilate isomerase [Paracraurococcus ruber]TDG32964.1 phosphoribosylanthranilate isomerase [Paracraurococcus ruber]